MMVVPRRVFARRILMICSLAPDTRLLLERGFDDIAVHHSDTSAHQGKQVLLVSKVSWEVDSLCQWVLSNCVTQVGGMLRVVETAQNVPGLAARRLDGDELAKAVRNEATQNAELHRAVESLKVKAHEIRLLAHVHVELCL